MFYRLRQRSQDEAGFTLIELLVVILIIGILAAIAIPSLLAQKSKAYDAQAKSLVSSAQTAAETIATDNNGSYAKVSPTEINAYEKTIPIEEKTANGGSWISKAGPVTEASGEGYEVVATAPNTKDTFEILRKGTGEVERKCTEAGTSKGCPSGTW